jgi:hypothetical protein
MREHGVLNRILLIFEEVGRRIQEREAFPLDVVTGSAGMVRRFIEDYHERLEEDHLFPRFEAAGRLVDLVGVLRTQDTGPPRRCAASIHPHVPSARGA